VSPGELKAIFLEEHGRNSSLSCQGVNFGTSDETRSVRRYARGSLSADARICRIAGIAYERIYMAMHKLP